MALWSAFYPFVLPEVQGCPTPQIQHALRQATREFCDRSRVWQERAAALTGDGTTKTFAITVPATPLALGAELVRLERCTVAGDDFAIVSYDDMPPDWLETTEDNSLSFTCVQISQSQFRLYGTPDAGDSIVPYLSLQPSVATSTGVADEVFGRYAEAIAAGALKRLWGMAGKVWSKPESIGMAHEAFERGIHTAANFLLRQNKPMRTGRTKL